MNNTPPWHNLSITETMHRLTAAVEGLTTQEADKRLTFYGNNTITAGPPYSAMQRFIAQFKNVLIYILLVSALVTALIQHWTDTGVIMAVIFINAVIGFIQEQKAEKALAAIRDLLSPHATVLRDSELSRIDAAQLVPGDVVILAAGDKVPADLRLMEAHHLRIQEAILTGESLDVAKSELPVALNMPLGSRTNIAHCGTLVTTGQGKGMVVATASQTEIGRISHMIREVESPQSNLTIKIARFSRWLAFGIIVLAVSIFFFGIYIRGLSMEEMFMVMIGIAVSAIPEGLPAVISISMAMGVRTMARRNAIVRHLPVVEALGSVTVICTDKTGTLTRNELVVTDVITAEHAFHVTGTGYSPEGSIMCRGNQISHSEHPTIQSMGCAGMLNNDAVLNLEDNEWKINGDPTEAALMAFANKTGQNLEYLRNKMPRMAVIPFSAETCYMATLHPDIEGENIVYVKGAPEQILAICDMQQTGSNVASLQEDYWQERVAELARKGKRVLAVAYQRVTKQQHTLSHENVQSGYTLLGLFGIMDTPRTEARAAIAACLHSGITVKMITGDHELTASSIGELLGIPNSSNVMTGAEIESLSNDALAKAVEGINIYARMHPEHKLRLVKALQTNKEIVAMTGDGVNDAPALKCADIGIAMGKQGTEVAKEASDLVLADDNFASIVDAVEQGRNIFRNIRNTIQFMLVTDCTEGLTLVIAMLAGLALPITPLQILWVNMVTAVTLSLAFAFAPRDSSVMLTPPLPPDMPLFSSQSVWTLLWHTGLIATGTIGLFLYEMQRTGDIAEARTIAVNVLVFFQIFYLWGMLPAQKKLIHMTPALLAITGVLVLQLAFTYMPWMQDIFTTSALGINEWLKLIIVSSVILLWLFIERRWRKGGSLTSINSPILLKA